ncbi:hypothetical protein HETIRDRAFT_156155 [Heterobasidion irregulare TC 32-1]|uniref:FAD-binding FR-type domain-containing protein n=1 Tax=Heterobasidion irregulare (strain TC 32-1) TaxID=747525 RepID=W4K0L0_HETIT|nr:uncharacterized protein HETIRDRAFT_156155 [Heterobasidion irregulare TC 32-1]ETW79353.1 hypothetical protein HETIRDRAFT_156155 [Heterobasidion irregulare TC 32-1]
MSNGNALKGWHPGEKAIQEIIHLPARVSLSAVTSKLPEQHRIFHTTRLHFLPTTTLDEHGRPWASFLCSADGRPSFITAPSDSSLVVQARVWPGDPIIDNLQSKRTPKLISAIGLETATRRRNKFAGYVSNTRLRDGIFTLELTVNQALGLCPKYINIRTLRPHVDTHPHVAYNELDLDADDRLPNDVISFIHSCDTAYLATSYEAAPSDRDMYPSHVATNHRGGRPGFVRVRPSDHRTLVLPNYAGNRLMNSLGNIFVTPLAGLVFPSFTDGSVLYVTGSARTLFGSAAQALMPGSNVVTTIYATGFVFVEDALPLRQNDNSIEPSPYCPPVLYLAEETPPTVSYGDITLSLIQAQIHDATLVTYTLKSNRAVDIKPSQYVVLDLSHFLRIRSHELVEWDESERTENDDCVRTWTVSHNPTPQTPHTFSITVRTISGGLITPILYAITSRAAERHQAGDVVDMMEQSICFNLRGVGGEFTAPEPVAACDGGRRLLWVAGGIGLTPFLSLTRHVALLANRGYGVWDVALVISTREPEVMLHLLSEALHVSKGASRLDEDGKLFSQLEAKDREVQICGPLPFVQSAMKSLERAGVRSDSVKRERFTY